MAVTTNEMKEIIETITNSSAKAQINSAIDDISAFLGGTYTSASDFDNVSVAKSTPDTGIYTFTFSGNYGVSVSFTYRA